MSPRRHPPQRPDADRRDHLRQRHPLNGSGPDLSIDGNGRGCNGLTGSFTVTEATFGGPDSSYVQDFVATFEQHCEGAEPALRGTISIHNPPAPSRWSWGSPWPGTAP